MKDKRNCNQAYPMYGMPQMIPPMPIYPNTYQNTFYSVETFWGMTSKPKFDLYCYRNRTNNHPPLSELAVKHPILQEQKKLSRIQNSIEKLMAFKGSYKL